MTFTLDDGSFMPDTVVYNDANSGPTNTGLSKLMAVPADYNAFVGDPGAAVTVNGQVLLQWDGEGAFASAGATAGAILSGNGAGMLLEPPTAVADNTSQTSDWLLYNAIALPGVSTGSSGFISSYMTFSYANNNANTAMVFTPDGPEIGLPYFPRTILVPPSYDPLGESLNDQNPQAPITLYWDGVGAYTSGGTLTLGTDIMNDNADPGLALVDPAETAQYLSGNGAVWALFDRGVSGSSPATEMQYMIPSLPMLYPGVGSYMYILPSLAMGFAYGAGSPPMLSGDVSPSSFSVSSASQNYSDVYTYDINSNRTEKVHYYPGSGSETSAYQYNGNDELTIETDTFSGASNVNTIDYYYDPNGSQTQTVATTNTGGGTTTTNYTYDVRNKMVGYSNGTTSATYVYDDDGNRVQETTNGTTSFYLTDAANPTGYAQPIEVWTSTTGSLSGATLNTTYLIGDRIFGQDVAGTMSYLLVDGRGYTRLVTNASGAVTATLNYDADGDITSSSGSGSASTIFEYPDGPVDPASGLRMPGDGTRDLDGFYFLERDPTSGNNSDPISLHKYLYADADSPNEIDPTGFYSIEAALLGTAVHAYLDGLFEGDASNGTYVFGNRAVSTIIRTVSNNQVRPSYSGTGRLRPDLAAATEANGCVYEIKPGDVEDIEDPAEFMADAQPGINALKNLYLPALNFYAAQTQVFWTPGVSWAGAEATYPNFPLNPPGKELTTFSNFEEAPGVILYDFVPKVETDPTTVETVLDLVG